MVTEATHQPLLSSSVCPSSTTVGGQAVEEFRVGLDENVVHIAYLLHRAHERELGHGGIPVMSPWGTEANELGIRNGHTQGKI